MRFTIRTLMIGIAAVALILVLPATLLGLLEMSVWYVVPSLLVAFLLYGTRRQRSFAIGSLSVYLAISLQRTHLMGWGVLGRWVLCGALLGLGGAITVWLEPRLADGAAAEQPPPPPSPHD